MIPQNYALAARAIWDTYYQNTKRLGDMESVAVRNPEIDKAIKRVVLPSGYNRTLMGLAEIMEGQARFLEQSAYLMEQLERRDRLLGKT